MRGMGLVGQGSAGKGVGVCTSNVAGGAGAGGVVEGRVDTDVLAAGVERDGGVMNVLFSFSLTFI